MTELFEMIFSVSMLVFVAGSMVTLGLGLTIPQIIEPFKNIKMVALTLIANFIVVPLFAFALVWLVPVSEGVRTGILLLALGGGAPFIPTIVETAKGYVAGAIGLMLLLLVVTIFYMPVVAPFIFSGASVSSWDIARSLIFTMLIPLTVALFVKARYPDVAAGIRPVSEKITKLSVLFLVITVVVLYTDLIISNASVLLVILLFFLGSMAIGYFTGGRNREVRFLLVVGTSLRNPPVAMLVASHSFPAQPMAAMVPLLIVIVGLSILFPLAKVIGNKLV